MKIDLIKISFLFPIHSAKLFLPPLHPLQCSWSFLALTTQKTFFINYCWLPVSYVVVWRFWGEFWSVKFTETLDRFQVLFWYFKEYGPKRDPECTCKTITCIWAHRNYHTSWWVADMCCHTSLVLRFNTTGCETNTLRLAIGHLWGKGWNPLSSESVGVRTQGVWLIDSKVWVWQW